MAVLNKKGVDNSVNKSVRLAGGAGVYAARQSALAQLKRLAMTYLLWEDGFYTSGVDIQKSIKDLIPQCNPAEVADLIVKSRTEAGLRHLPIMMALEMLKYPEHKSYVADIVRQIVTRADQITDMIALYRSSNGIKANSRWTLPAQLKKGLGSAFTKFDEYQLAKYNRPKEVKLKDALRIVHPTPLNDVQSSLWKRLLDDKLTTPNTWEVNISANGNKKEVWEPLLANKVMPDLAFLRNLRNMLTAGVDIKLIKDRMSRITDKNIWPLNFIIAEMHAPALSAELDAAMQRCYTNLAKLPGTSLIFVDLSGSMGGHLASKSELTYLNAAQALAMLAVARSERAIVVATAGSDGTRTHASKIVPTRHGFGLRDVLDKAKRELGGGGIFTAQTLRWAKENVKEPVDRIIVLSDSQDCDLSSAPKAAPFAKYNYIINVSPERYGVNYNGVWSAEISGFSEGFINYIAANENLEVQQLNDN